MPLKLKSDLSKLINNVKRSKKRLNNLDNEIKKIANEVKSNIIRDTASGIDVKGRAFTPYSKKYAREKGSSKVNLRLKGDMLNSMRIRRLRKNKYELSFSGNLENIKASVHNKGINKMPKREFFGISKKSKSVIKKLINNFGKKVIKVIR